MNLTLLRTRFMPSGIFGELSRDDTGERVAVTLEHSYGGKPKLAEGVYTAVRHPPNRLPYDTFMVKGVPDFDGQRVTGILIHVGNYQQDSEGCILVGDSVGPDMITQSKHAFERFMTLQTGAISFQLTVLNYTPGPEGGPPNAA